MHCGESPLRPNLWLASFSKADSTSCHCPEFACMSATTFLRRFGAMAECSWECVKLSVQRIACMYLPIPTPKTQSSLANVITRADMVIVTWQKRRSVVNTTSVRVRWRILRNCTTLWVRHWRLGATNISTLRPRNFAISRPPAKILCAHFGLESITRFSNASCVCDCGKRRTIVSPCAERSTAHLVRHRTDSPWRGRGGTCFCMSGRTEVRPSVPAFASPSKIRAPLRLECAPGPPPR